MPDFDSNAWLADVTQGAEISDEQRNVITEVLKDAKVAENIRASTMRLTDYSKDKDALRLDKERLQTEYDDKFTALSQTEEQNVDERKRLQADLARVQGEHQQVAAALNKAATEYDFKVDDLGVETTPQARQPGSNGDGEYLTRQQTEKLVNDSMQAGFTKSAEVYALYGPELANLAAEHQKLYGEHLDQVPLVHEHLKTGTAIIPLWEQKYDVPAKRAEVAQASLDAKLETARQQGIEEGIRQTTLPPGSGDVPAGNLVQRVTRDLAEKAGNKTFGTDNNVPASSRAAATFRKRQLARSSPAAA